MKTPTSYQERSAAVQAKIFATDYWPSRYSAVLQKHGMTAENVAKHLYEDRQLHAMWEDFWWYLPDNESIRVQPFFEICDLCEEEV